MDPITQLPRLPNSNQSKAYRIATRFAWLPTWLFVHVPTPDGYEAKSPTVWLRRYYVVQEQNEKYTHKGIPVYEWSDRPSEYLSMNEAVSEKSYLESVNHP